MNALAPAFGLDANIAPPPLAALLSLAMIAGVDALGLVILRTLLPAATAAALWLRCQAPLIGAAALATVTFPLALAGIFPRALALAFAVTLVCWGSLHGVRLVRRRALSSGRQKAATSPPSCEVDACHRPDRWSARVRAACRRESEAPGFILGAVVVGYVLLALGPVTESDARQ